jgi:glycerol-3-phosphate acyltransferase PlsX
MGGDHAPGAIVEGALRAAAAGVPVVLVGDAAVLAPLAPGVEVVDAPEALPMDAGAAEVRRRDACSVRVATRLVADGRCSSVVSCGSSGGTLVAAVIDLGLLEGVDRPALVASLPRADGGTLYVLDVGATVECRADHLAQFAVLGDAWARVQGVASPRVGLLSNGAEAHKGTRAVRDAAVTLARLPIDFRGLVEPHGALAGEVDVLVCDGFAGNVLLKTAEGVVAMLRAVFFDALRATGQEAQALPLLHGTFDVLRTRLDWRSRGGAVLVGARAPVIVGHGRADAAAVDAAVRLAHYAASHRLTEDVSSRLGAALAVVGEGGRATGERA